MVGEEQILKGEYKVISGRVYVIFLLSTWSTPRLGLFRLFDLFLFSSSSNDLAWDGESKRIIAVGDGKEKSVQPFTSDFWCDTTIKKLNLFSLRLGLAMLFLWIRVLRLERFLDIQK